MLGVDLDPRAVDRASRRFRAPNLRFRPGDIQRWDETIDREPFDAVVSFDTIEHVLHRELMLHGVVEHLVSDGELLLSTPCGSWSNELEPAWSKHRIEYSAPFLFDLLSRYFRTILRPDDRSLPRLEVLDGFVARGLRYVIWMNPVVLRDPIRIPCPFAKGP